MSPARFWGLHPGRQVEVTLPITQARGMIADVNARWFQVVARLRRGATAEQATVQADTIFQSFMKDRHVSEEMRRKRFDHMVLTPASQGPDRLRSRFSGPLYALIAAAGIVLLIACVNLGLFGVAPADPANYLLGAAVLVVVACVAAWLPARRACSVQPAELLRRG